MNFAAVIKGKITEIIISAVVSALISGSIGYFITMKAQREASLMQIAMTFAQDSQPLVNAFGSTMTAIRLGNDLEREKNGIRELAAEERATVESLKLFFPADINDAVNEYETALSEYISEMRSVNSAVELPIWTETFDRMITKRGELANELAKAAKLKD
jgi:hypothetical protein